MDVIEPRRYSSAAAEASRVVKDMRGYLIGFIALNGNAALRNMQIFDAAALPADGVVPALVFPCAIAGVVVNIFPVAIPFYNGIVVCNSSTASTKTIGAADSLFTVLYA